MKDELITFKTAVLAKEKGFNEVCQKSYIGTPAVQTSDINHKNTDYIHRCSAPTQSLLQRWLREVHNIFVSCSYDHIKCDGTYFIWYGVMAKSCDSEHGFKSYEEALEAGLQEALKLI